MKKVLILAFVAFFMTTLSAQAPQKGQEPKSVKVSASTKETKQVPEQPTQNSKEKLPEITFESLVHDYGTITQGDNGSCYFEFKNTGKADLVLTNCSSSCGCTVPEWPKESIAPGKTGKIKVTYNTQRLGGINKMVYVDSNVGQRVTLKITGNVLAKPVEASPETTPSPVMQENK